MSICWYGVFERPLCFEFAGMIVSPVQISRLVCGLGPRVVTSNAGTIFLLDKCPCRVWIPHVCGWTRSHFWQSLLYCILFRIYLDLVLIGAIPSVDIIATPKKRKPMTLQVWICVFAFRYVPCFCWFSHEIPHRKVPWNSGTAGGSTCPNLGLRPSVLLSRSASWVTRLDAATHGVPGIPGLLGPQGFVCL